MARIAKKSNKGQNRDAINFTAIDMLHDPQSFAEKLFKQLESTNGDFALKLLHIRVIARVIGVHKLVIYNFYPYLQRFLNPSQRDVTLVLQVHDSNITLLNSSIVTYRRHYFTIKVLVKEFVSLFYRVFILRCHGKFHRRLHMLLTI